MPRALVIGCSGQDGAYLTELLLQKNYEVIGVGRDAPFATVDITDRSAVTEFVAASSADEIYYLAAYHHASEDVADEAKLVTDSFRINTLALDNFLHAVVATESKARLFYAASSLVFAAAASVPQDEATPMAPQCPYGISKAAGVHLCRYYRSQRQVHSCVGFLYNHESPRRKPHFLTRKITSAVVRIERGIQTQIVVGNLDAQVDWGYAPEYADAMWRVLQLDEPDDFVIATGTLNSVRGFVQVAFDVVGLRWQDHVVEDRSLIKQNRTNTTLLGNPEKIRRRTGWKPQYSFERMVRELVEHERRCDALAHK